MQARRRARSALLAVALVLVSASCSGRNDGFANAPLIVISIDTLRSDHLPAYGYRGVATPHIDRLVGDSVLFERAYSQYPLTLPSHASILTGLLPPRNGVRDNLAFELGEEHETLAERLRAAGYRTRGVVSSMVLRGSTGIAQGFEEYDDAMPRRGLRQRTFAQRPGNVAVETAATWLRQLDGEQPFFLFVHLFDPHTPYAAPEPYASRYASAYDAEIAYADQLVGELFTHLEEAGLFERSLIVFLSDHGEGLGDHVELEHGLTLYREALQVPLMFKLPSAARAGERIDAPVALVDVTPTILDLLGLEYDGLDGRPLLGDSPRHTGEPIYSETFFPRYQFGWSELRSIVRGELHLIDAPRAELFDLLQDPAERADLLPERETPQAMVSALDAVGEGAQSMAAVSDEELRQLAALGYVGTATESADGVVLPDPKDHIAELEALWALIRRDDGELPDDARVRELLATVAGDNESLHRATARSLLYHGRTDIADEILRPFADSADAETRVLLGKVATTQGRLADAGSHFRRALELDAEHPEAHLGMGTLLLTQGDDAQARRWLERAVALEPELAEAWNGLGVTRARAGDLRGAIEAWERTVQSDPRLADAWFNLALARRQAGDDRGAGAALERYAELVDGDERRRALALLRELDL